MPINKMVFSVGGRSVSKRESNVKRHKLFVSPTVIFGRNGNEASNAAR